MRPLPLCVLMLGAAAWPSVVHADPIRIFQDARIAATGTLLVVDRQHTVARDRQDAADHLASSVDLVSGDVSGSAAAALSSRIAGDAVSGTGSLSATATVLPSPDVFRHALTDATSELILGFELDAPLRFDFMATFAATTGVESDADLEGPAGLVLFQTPPMSSGVVRERGVIPAGRWGLRVFQMTIAMANAPAGSVTEHGTYSFAFNTSPVLAQTPEPASIVLIGSGLLGVVASRRRRRD